MSDLTRDMHLWKQAAGFNPVQRRSGDIVILEVDVFGSIKHREYDLAGNNISRSVIVGLQKN